VVTCPLILDCGPVVPVDDTHTRLEEPEEDSLYQAKPVGRSRDGRRAAEHDAVLYPRPVPGATISNMATSSDVLRPTIDLFEVGVEIMRQNLRRDDPLADDEEIDRRLSQWLRTRPGAEFGDCPGRPVDLSIRRG
jgi:hypothetical protein